MDRFDLPHLLYLLLLLAALVAMRWLPRFRSGRDRRRPRSIGHEKKEKRPKRSLRS
ncbi:hypothetical protein DesfrDRAFT_1286 [Solidesulfovibrio fructosivorans JJ]]|uniref:Uncharacterized protein n=1 Tax=Solidesulfovibrio fructosivorans JJ] TaxID=596151 RepID=E1JUI7_SOLFR|nr:hypothetical protein [Solidesulfovibrio fructosivorans]EFL52117.1 hypothetical protein DesfrDRAFT_1286 [Solidesulfovibrio fructosivorans JJ]]